MKRCPRCERWLSLECFSLNASKRDGRQPYCRTCQRAYSREHYVANRSYYVAKAKASKKRSRVIVRDLLREMKSVPCTDCGRSYPYWVMDFDHTGDDKVICVSRGSEWGRKKTLAEAAKCDVVCANCHRIRTTTRLAEADP